MALIRGNTLGHQIDEAYGLRQSLQRHVVSIASQAEIWVLADRHQWGEAKRDALRIMFEQVVIVPIDGQQILDAYVKVAAAANNYQAGSRNMGKNDLWIAATALHTGLPLLTTDKDFLFLNKNLLTVFWVDPDVKKQK
jgi:tRNA(fMet)-specific endonuclease VapC